MTDKEYLEAVLEDQALQDVSEELKALRAHRKVVEDLLREKFGSAPSIRYGGSYTKGTMNRVSYDLDIICYFSHDDHSAGSTLREIFEAVEEVLREKYWTESKGSSIRLRSRDEVRADFHIDVVPGRFVNGKEGDVYLYRSTGEKGCLKTNLDIHIDHVRNSGVISAIRLMKLLAKRNHVGVKTFALELLVIEMLKGRKTRALPDQVESVLKELRDNVDSLTIEDPANPTGNDLSELLNATVRWNLQSLAGTTLETLEREGWQWIFGEMNQQTKEKKAAALTAMAAAATVRPRPYHSGDALV